MSLTAQHDLGAGDQLHVEGSSDGAAWSALTSPLTGSSGTGSTTRIFETNGFEGGPFSLRFRLAVDAAGEGDGVRLKYVGLRCPLVTESDGSIYSELSGTSMSTPHVAGTAALLLGAFPDAKATEVRAAIVDGVDQVASLAGKTVTGGRLNAASALALLTDRLAPPPTAPSAPTIGTAVAGDAQATVSWTAPPSDARAPVTGYVVTPYAGTVAQTPVAFASTATTQTVTGLSNGTRYTFTVAATNASGTGSPSDQSNYVYPADEVAPVLTSFTRAGTSSTYHPGDVVTFNYTATDTSTSLDATVYMQDQNGKVVFGNTGYGHVTGGPPGTITMQLGATEAPGNYSIYQVQIRDAAYGGTIAFYYPSGAVVMDPSTAIGSRSHTLDFVSPGFTIAPPATAPSVPTGVTATAGNTTAQVSWTAPAPNGSPITGYTVTSSPGGLSTTVSGTSTSAQVTGLANGTAYTFTIVATNAIGSSTPSSPSNSVIPAAPPSAPTGVTAVAGTGTAQVKWIAPSANGSPITGYTVTSSPGGQTATVSGTGTSAVVTGLTAGRRYTFTVVATNAVGSSAGSAPSNRVTIKGGKPRR